MYCIRCSGCKKICRAVLIIYLKYGYVQTVCVLMIAHSEIHPSTAHCLFVLTLNLMTLTSAEGQTSASHTLLYILHFISLSPAQSLLLISAYCPRPVPKCSSFIFVFICQISEALVPLHITPQNIKLESLPNLGRSMDKGWQA